MCYPQKKLPPSRAGSPAPLAAVASREWCSLDRTLLLPAYRESFVFVMLKMKN